MKWLSKYAKDKKPRQSHPRVCITLNERIPAVVDLDQRKILSYTPEVRVEIRRSIAGDIFIYPKSGADLCILMECVSISGEQTICKAVKGFMEATLPMLRGIGGREIPQYGPVQRIKLGFGHSQYSQCRGAEYRFSPRSMKISNCLKIQTDGYVIVYSKELKDMNPLINKAIPCKFSAVLRVTESVVKALEDLDRAEMSDGY